MKKVYKIYEIEPASNEFKLILSETGWNTDTESHLLVCSECQRTSLSNSWRLGITSRKISAIEKQIQDCPDKFVFTNDDDPVAYSRYNGRVVVLDCPCNFLARIEKELLGNRVVIEKLFKTHRRLRDRSMVRTLSQPRNDRKLDIVFSQ